MKIAPIKNAADHRRALARAAELIDARPGTRQSDELEILSLMVERWEQQHFPLPAPSAIEAIRFRMAQSSLANRDLEPMIGSRARVSEILSGKRTLTLEMIRALSIHLQIPLEILVGTARQAPSGLEPPSARALSKLRELGLMRPKEKFDAFVARAFGSEVASAHFRKTRTQRTNAKTDEAALLGWCAAAAFGAERIQLAGSTPRFSLKHARALAQLSRNSDGLEQARDWLSSHGVVLIFLEHLPGTYLDGAAMRRPSDGAPTIALTLRHDRIDNFWFTLLHEFIHVILHLKSGRQLIIDDLEVRGGDALEREADQQAQDALIPPDIWARHNSPALQIEDVLGIAAEALVHPAVVAGRWQREHGDYRRFAKLVGHGAVRRVLCP